MTKLKTAMIVPDRSAFTYVGRLNANGRYDLFFSFYKAHSGNSAIVSWLAPATGFLLQTNGNLATSNWVNYGGTIATSNGTYSVTITPPTGRLFFRLANP